MSARTGIAIVAALAATGCVGGEGPGAGAASAVDAREDEMGRGRRGARGHRGGHRGRHEPVDAPDPEAVERGRRLWFEATYGGERFFAWLAEHPDPRRRIEIGFRNVLVTPRAERFERWGTINDPDCVANPDGGMDLCEDPHATGVIGIRRFAGPGGEPLFGVACASCHAGFDPLHPPRDPAEPTWDDIHPTIGNQHLRAGSIFAANLPPDDPRRLLFAAWPDGTVDTSLLFDDHVLNPGTITAFWNVPFRPTFDIGEGAEKIRSGQGGEDDRGGEIAALRVYTNIGVCFFECVAPAIAAERPLSIDQCRRDCADLPPPEDLADLVAFMRSIRAPRYRGPVAGRLYARGRRVFLEECAGCHDIHGRRRRVLSSDEVVPLRADPANTTHACRALASNWEEGHIWAEFSSDVYKARVAAGDRGYRVMPLTGIWATPPFLHNQSVGFRPWATATPRERIAVFEASMWALLSSARTPRVHRISVALGPFPAGTPATLVFSRDPDTGRVLCADVIENRGHHYGAHRSDADKRALIEFLKFQ